MATDGVPISPRSTVGYRLGTALRRRQWSEKGPCLDVWCSLSLITTTTITTSQGYPKRSYNLNQKKDLLKQSLELSLKFWQDSEHLMTPNRPLRVAAILLVVTIQF